MLHIRPLKANIELSMQDFRKTLLALSEQGWTPALLQSEREFLRLAGVDTELPLRAVKPITPGMDADQHTGFCEMFFRGEDIYYFIGMDGVRRMLFDPEGGKEPVIEIGIISRNGSDADKKIKSFSSAVEMAVRRGMDNSRVRNLAFEWQTPELDRRRLDELMTAPTTDGASFEEPELSDELKAGAEILCDKLTRGILSELVRAGFARTSDILAERPDEGEKTRLALDKMRRAGLTVKEHLLECKKFGTPLTRLKDPESINGDVGDLVCPSCGIKFRQESMCEGYSVSELGERLEANNCWLAVHVMSRLAELGVPMEFMAWKSDAPGDGVGVSIQFMGKFWTFELTDGQFGSQDVLGFNYRRACYSPDDSFIMATAGINRDAKMLFKELSGGKTPVYLENIESALNVLREKVYEASLSYACLRLNLVEELTGFTISTVTAKRFEKKQPAAAAAPRPAAEAPNLPQPPRVKSEPITPPPAPPKPKPVNQQQEEEQEQTGEEEETENDVQHASRNQ